MILLYGLKKGETRDYMETLLATNCKTPADLEKVKMHASAHGFHSFRVANYIEGEKPDFAKTLNI